MKFSACLAGNPNCGKTTLFNALTGSDMHVGNWPGVTVEKLEGHLTRGDTRITIVDLPGVYSLFPYSIEETITRDYIEAGEADVVLAVVDATCARRGMYLAVQLMERGLNVVIAFNLMDEMRKRGARADVELVGKLLGVRVAAVSARSGEGLERLIEVMANAAGAPMKRELQSDYPIAARRAVAAGEGTGEELTAAAAARYALIDRVLDAAGFPPGDDGGTRSEKVDRVVLKPYLAFPLCVLALGAVFFVTFGYPGTQLRNLLEACIELAERGCGVLMANSPGWVRSMVIDGIIAGVGGVLTFLPQLLLMFGALAFLEDSGCMARLAFIADRPLRALGLSGRSFIPMILGLGCTTTAAAAARGVENQRDRRMTILLTPFMSCGARLPVYSLMAAAVFPNRQGMLIPAMYILGFCVMALAGAALRATVFSEGESPFLMELPEYRLPTFKSALRRVGTRAREFMVRAGSLIFAASVVIWAMRYFAPDMSPASEVSGSILGVLAGRISPIFVPLGFGDAPRCAALMTGLIAKEAIVSTMQVVYAPGAEGLMQAVRGAFTPSSALAFCVFTLLYTPCVSALAAMRRELGSGKLFALGIAMQMTAAYVCAFLAYRIGAVIF